MIPIFLLRLGMVDLVEYIKCQKWLHLFTIPILDVCEEEVRDFYYILKFSDDGQKLSSMVQGVEIHLDENILGEILDVPEEGIRPIKGKDPSLEFILKVSKLTGKLNVGILNKYLKVEFQLMFGFANKVLLPRSKKGIVAFKVDQFMMETLSKF